MRGHDDHASGREPERIEPEEVADAVPPDPGPGTGTTVRPADRGVSRFRLRNWRLRSKLAVVLLVPALSTLTLAGLRLDTQLEQVELFGKVQRELRLSAQAAAVSDALQLERDAAVWFVAGGRSDNAAELLTRAGKVDQEVGRYRDVARNTAGIDDAVFESFQKSLQALDGLPSLRNTTQTTQYPDISVASAYAQVLNALAQVHRATSSSLSNEIITPLAGANQALYSAKEQLSQQNAILLSAAKRGEFAPGQENALRAAQSRLDAALADFANTASQENRQLYSDVVSGGSVDARNRLVQLSLVQQAESDKVSIADAEVMRVGEETAGLIRKAALDIEGQADRASVELAEAASASAWRDAALVAVALVIAFALMAFVARSMLTPLRLLRRSAMDVARNRLPEAIKRIRTHRDPGRAAEESLVPVPIHTTEEVGQVARAFDAVQREAIRLAVEQVALRANVNDMFINLSRRSQALVERQITVIDRLEQDEQDPDQLASLFELDHLATQMRRNSENLLVLSGTTVNRRVTRPVPISEVLGAAVSEVEKYARVQIAPAPEMRVQGRVVNDLAHLIAELLDNATAFSKPSTKVTVRAIETRRGEVSIRIHDRGVGMQEQDIIEANAKLAEPPEVDVSVAREMGLYVVGQLAKRHEIRVTLNNNDDIEGGVTAQVVLPVSLLHRGPEQAQPRPALPVQAEPGPEESGVAVLAGVPKWTPDQAPASFAGPARAAEPAPTSFPHTVATPADDGPNYFQVERTPAEDLFTATVDETVPPPDGAIDYSYPGAAKAPPVVVEVDEDDASTQRLPIYEDVLSRWFQGGEGAEAPVHGELTDDVPPESPAEKTMFADRIDLVGPDNEAESPAPRADRPAARGADKVGRVGPEPTAAGLPKRSPAPSPVPAATTGWGPSDDGWTAANSVLKSSVDDTTTAGLPKRTPKARLMPGSLSAPPPRADAPNPPAANGNSAGAAGVATAAPPRRSADRLRQRFATYQRGIQLGRESADDSLPWEGLSHGDGENPGNQSEEQK
ncbi:sensor histidine kinase [Saccharothrix obliqua]|uniref:sensor histidine kinase n=1 Tax=Saccharothrix obliqua TaxID=2861747 RepID=UPI001C5F595F|nr:nitrate- and nitrite sensing domain-containing protein [Saccharothrix obliqua]MBW4721148.1 nitrate- and nitrite sensing domain-containing protein [Saccharothrix obliqua]